MKKIISGIVLLFLSGMLYCQTEKGYNISLSVKGLSQSSVYLAYHLGNRQYIKDSVKLDMGGNSTFKGENKLDKGVYIIVLPGNRYFEFLMTDDQHFSISCETTDLAGSLRFAGSQENSSFAEYQRNLASRYRKSDELKGRLEANKQNPDSVKALTSMGKELEASTRSYMKEVTESNKGSFMSALILAMQPVVIPEFNIPSTANRDSIQWVLGYNYNKDHFFDNFNLSDERLLRSPIFHSKLSYYFNDILLQLPDSIIKGVDKVLALSSGTAMTYQYTAVFLFNNFRESAIMGHDAVMVKIADEVYLSGKAEWASKEFIDNLRRDVDKIRPSLIGNQAINLTMETLEHGTVSLSGIKKEFTILYFWEPDCGHCVEATPMLRDYYLKNSNNVEVLAICTQTDREKWQKYIKDNKLTWINGWDPDRVTHYDFFYNVVSTPTVFILDRNKKIIAKKLPIESIEGFIESYRKHGR